MSKARKYSTDYHLEVKEKYVPNNIHMVGILKKNTAWHQANVRTVRVLREPNGIL